MSCKSALGKLCFLLVWVNHAVNFWGNKGPAIVEVRLQTKVVGANFRYRLSEAAPTKEGCKSLRKSRPKTSSLELLQLSCASACVRQTSGGASDSGKPWYVYIVVNKHDRCRYTSFHGSRSAVGETTAGKPCLHQSQHHRTSSWRRSRLSEPW